MRKITAYCLLIHAEIESYITTLIKEKVRVQANKHKENPSLIIVPNLCFWYGSKLKTKSILDVDKALNCYLETFKNINGVKIANMESMLNPVGMWEEVNVRFNSLLSELDSFGATRGDFAHKSFNKCLRNIPSPVDIQLRVIAIIEDLKIFEEYLKTKS